MEPLEVLPLGCELEIIRFLLSLNQVDGYLDLVPVLGMTPVDPLVIVKLSPNLAEQMI